MHERPRFNWQRLMHYLTEPMQKTHLGHVQVVTWCNATFQYVERWPVQRNLRGHQWSTLHKLHGAPQNRAVRLLMRHVPQLLCNTTNLESIAHRTRASSCLPQAVSSDSSKAAILVALLSSVDSVWPHKWNVAVASCRENRFKNVDRG